MSTINLISCAMRFHRLLHKIVLLTTFFAWLLLPARGVAQLRISTDKDTINFTKVKLPFSRDATIRISNISSSTVEVRELKVIYQSSVPSEFQIVVPQPTVFHIDSGDSRSVIIRFKPNIPGIRTAILDIVTDEGIKEVYLFGEGSTIQPDVLMYPQSIDFGMLAPGEFKDTTIIVVGSDKDSATVQWIDVANDNAAVYFDVKPLNPLTVLPVLLKYGDTLKLNVRFTAFNSSGPRTGKATLQGEVSGSIVCDFRGSVGIADMIFSPQLLDLGIVPQGNFVDTFISIASIGESSVKLLRVDAPILPYSLIGLPSFPHLVSPGDSLHIRIHFDAVSTGNFEEPISAFSKNGIAAGINRSALLKAIVIPRVLAKKSPLPFVASCVSDSSYEQILTISDTGQFMAFVTSVSCSDPDFSAIYPSTYPDTLKPGSSRDIIIRYKSKSSGSVTSKSCFIIVNSNGRVLLRDTILLVANSVRASLATIYANQPSSTPYSSTIGIVTRSDLSSYNIKELDMDFEVTPTDVAEIDILNVSIDKSIFPNASFTITYDAISHKYHGSVISSTPLISSPVLPFLNIPIKYFVSRDSSAILYVATRSPEKYGCLFFQDDSLALVPTNQCGDKSIREVLQGHSIVSSVNINPNPSTRNTIVLSFYNNQQSTLTLSVSNDLGNLVYNENIGDVVAGPYAIRLRSDLLTSGTYLLRLRATSVIGLQQEVLRSLIISR